MPVSKFAYSGAWTFRGSSRQLSAAIGTRSRLTALAQAAALPRLLREETSYDVAYLQTKVTDGYKTLNHQQRVVFDAVLASVADRSGHIFALNACGGKWQDVYPKSHIGSCPSSEAGCTCHGHIRDCRYFVGQWQNCAQSSIFQNKTVQQNSSGKPHFWS